MSSTCCGVIFNALFFQQSFDPEGKESYVGKTQYSDPIRLVYANNVGELALYWWDYTSS
jgi:hypothetical protein